MQKATLSPHTSHINRRERYLSLDVLRGMTIALMIVVNTPGSWQSIYAPLRHAEWHGFTITDLVFPMFLFVVGNAMSFSMIKYEQEGSAAVLQKLFKRAGIIFIIGILLNLFPFFYRDAEGALALKDFTAVRVMGVLQRIALCYLIAGLVIHFLKIKGAVVCSAVFLLGYWAVMWFFGDQADPYSLSGNAARKFDDLFFSDPNLYKGFGIPFDPEGLLSTIPATVNVFAGYFAGLYIQSAHLLREKIIRLSLVGIGLVAAALAWDMLFPINKPIWTSSYVLYATGWSLLVLAGLMTLIELFQVKNWTPFFEVFGKNPLFIYILSGVFIKLFFVIRIDGLSLHHMLYHNLFLSWTDGKMASLFYALSYTLFLWSIGWWMMRRRIFIKV